MKLMLALERKRTTALYGYHHYCKKHQKIVDHNHIDECELTMRPGIKISEITSPLASVDTIWEIEPSVMREMEHNLDWLSKRIALIEGTLYMLVKAKNPS